MEMSKKKDKTPEEIAFEQSIEWILLKKTVNQIPYELMEKNIFKIKDIKMAKSIIMGLLNDMKFLKKILTDELGEDKAVELFYKLELFKQSSFSLEAPGYGDDSFDPYLEYLKKEGFKVDEIKRGTTQQDYEDLKKFGESKRQTWKSLCNIHKKTWRKRKFLKSGFF